MGVKSTFLIICQVILSIDGAVEIKSLFKGIKAKFTHFSKKIKVFWLLMQKDLIIIVGISELNKELSE